jgi:transposase
MPSLTITLARVRHLEDLALRAFQRFEGEPMEIAKEIDAERVARIRSLHAEGQSNAAIAAAVGVARSTASKYSRDGANGEASRPAPAAVKANGHLADPELLALIETRWNAMPVLERLKVLLSRGA